MNEARDKRQPLVDLIYHLRTLSAPDDNVYLPTRAKSAYGRAAPWIQTVDPWP